MKRRYRRRSKARFIIPIISILTASVILLVYADKMLRTTIYSYAKSRAEIILMKTADEAVLAVLEENGITYDSIVSLNTSTGNSVNSLEIDIVKINNLKSQITGKVAQLLEEREAYDLKIPVGTIIGNEYTIGRGPEITFPMKLSSTVVTKFTSNFYSAGINQVLHQILIDVDFDGYILIPWYRSSFSQSTNYIAAQTVIVGTVPEAYTNVIEDGISDMAGDINDYSADPR